MAYTKLNVQETTRAGLNATYSPAVAGGHAFDNSSGKVLIIVKNGSGASVTLTIGGTATIDGRTLPALTVAVPAAGERIIGPFAKGLYNVVDSDTSQDEAVQVGYSATSSVTIAAIKPGAATY